MIRWLRLLLCYSFEHINFLLGGLNCGIAFIPSSTDLLGNSWVHGGYFSRSLIFRKLVENYPVDRQSLVTLVIGFELAFVELVAAY